jgi:hypothetical protein
MFKGKKRDKLSFNKSDLRATLRLDNLGSAPYIGGGTNEPPVVGSAQEGSQSFGWMGRTNNSNTFYPNVEGAESVIPVDSDYYKSDWRLISATIVGAFTWKATDFSNEGVLKRSRKLLENKPLYRDHEAEETDNWVGIVKKPTWRESFIDSKGNRIPAGIDASLWIDAKANPRMVRAVAAGIVFSNSVTVYFDWEPSHDFEDEWEFERMIGKVIDDRMVTRVVTRIYDYFETSLVWLGADPYAKKYDEDDMLIHVDTTAIFEPQNVVETQNVKTVDKYDAEVVEKYKKDRFYAVSGKSLNLSYNKSKEKNFQQKRKSIMNEEAIKFLSTLLGLAEGTEITVETMTDLAVITDEVKAQNAMYGKVYESVTAVTGGEGETCLDGFSIVSAESAAKVETLTGELDTVKTELTTTKAKVTTLTEERDGLKEELEEAKPKVEIADSYMTKKKEEVIRLYKINAKDKVDETYLKIIEGADFESLDALLLKETNGVESKFSATCTKCGEAGSFTFRSSLVEGEEGEEGNENEADSLHSIEQFEEKYLSEKKLYLGK